MSGLGKPSPVTLRSYWKNEATDFTRWCTYIQSIDRFCWNNKFVKL